MYVWFRDQIYDGRSLIGLYWFCLLPLPLIVAPGMFASVKLDVRMNRDYEAGELAPWCTDLETEGVRP